MLQLEVKDSGRFRYVLLPELCGAGGWVDISKKFLSFCGWKCLEGFVDGSSFSDLERFASGRSFLSASFHFSYGGSLQVDLKYCSGWILARFRGGKG